MDAARMVARLRADAALPECRFPQWALGLFRGWRLQLTGPHPIDPEWHLSVSWRKTEEPNEKALDEVLAALGIDRSHQMQVGAALLAEIEEDLASKGLQRGQVVRHFFWREGKPS